MKNRAITAMITGMVLAAPLATKADPGQFIVTPFVGDQSFQSGRLVKGKQGIYGLGGEYQFTEHLGVELDYARAFSGMKVGSPSVDADYDRVSLDGIVYLGKMGYKQMYEPYFKAGVGHARYDYDQYGNDKLTDIDAGVGVRIHLLDRLALRPEVKALHEIDIHHTNYLFTVGLSYAFGGASKPAAAPEPAQAVVAPPPAPVDSDGDGVTDDKDKCPNTPRGLEVDADGCEYHLTKSEEVRVDIKFATNKSDIPEEYVSEVERVAKFLHKYASVKAEIAGHTDSVGADKYNEKLSQRRADAVKGMLVTRFGIDASRLTAMGYGESKPVADNSTADGRAQNRRVVAVMQAETSEPVMKK